MNTSSSILNIINLSLELFSMFFTFSILEYISKHSPEDIKNQSNNNEAKYTKNTDFTLINTDHITFFFNLLNNSLRRVVKNGVYTVFFDFVWVLVISIVDIWVSYTSPGFLFFICHCKTIIVFFSGSIDNISSKL